MKRLIPRTAAGQLIAVAMLALVISQIALTAIMLDERQHALRRWWADDILSRIASLVELLDATPGRAAHKGHQRLGFAAAGVLFQRRPRSAPDDR